MASLRRETAMSQPVSGFKTGVTATLAVRRWAQAVEFYKAAFGATELHRARGGGVVQLSVRGAEFWVAEESKKHLNFSPESLGGCSVRMLLIVEDPAAVCAQAVRPPERPRFIPSRIPMDGVSAALSIPPAIIGKLPNR